ncbi:MAG: hypothetical protein ACHQ2Z_13465, partial [Elusimicrobiota bacterium]
SAPSALAASALTPMASPSMTAAAIPVLAPALSPAAPALEARAAALPESSVPQPAIAAAASPAAALPAAPALSDSNGASKEWAASSFEALIGSGKLSAPAKAYLPETDSAPQITKHDGHRFEIKLSVPVVRGKKNVYRIATYFFVPHALGITPAIFTKEIFYRHIQRRIRFDTPKMSLGGILDEKNEPSPLNRLSAYLLNIGGGDKDGARAETAYNETRMLGAIASVSLRDQIGVLSAAADEAARSPEKLPALRERIASLHEETAGLVAKVRSLRTGLKAAGAPAKVQDTAAFLDEFLSLSISEHFVRLLGSIRQDAALRSALADADRSIAELVKSEDAYRAAAGFPSVVDKANASEGLFYRRAVLKNLFYGVLDLNTKTSDWAGALQVVFGICAGLAMVAYLVVLQIAQVHFSAGGAALLAVMAGGYIIKDRLKDALKIWSVRRWSRYFSDSVTAVRDPSTGKVVGKMRETFGFVPPGDVPPEILRLRRFDPLASVSADGKPEDVLRYDKEVTLKPSLIQKFHTRRRDLNDFLLVNLAPLLVQTEDPEVGFTRLDPATGELESLPGSQVYHMNMVTHYEVRQPAKSRTSTYDRLRVVMDRAGIKRIEKVSVP